MFSPESFHVKIWIESPQTKQEMTVCKWAKPFQDNSVALIYKAKREKVRLCVCVWERARDHFKENKRRWFDDSARQMWSLYRAADACGSTSWTGSEENNKSRCHVLPHISQVGRCKTDRGLIEVVVDVDVWVNFQVKLHIARSWNWIWHRTHSPLDAGLRVILLCQHDLLK